MFKWKIRGGPPAAMSSSSWKNPIEAAQELYNITTIGCKYNNNNNICTYQEHHHQQVIRRHLKGKGKSKGNDEVSLLLS